MLYSTTEAQPKQNTLVSLWRKNKRHGAWERKQILFYLLLLHLNWACSLCWFWMSVKKVCTKETRRIPWLRKGDTNYREWIWSYFLLYSVFEYHLVHKCLVHISYDANSRIWEHRKYFHSVVFIFTSYTSSIALWIPITISTASYWRNYHEIWHRLHKRWWFSDFSSSGINLVWC